MLETVRLVHNLVTRMEFMLVCKMYTNTRMHAMQKVHILNQSLEHSEIRVDKRKEAESNHNVRMQWLQQQQPFDLRE